MEFLLACLAAVMIGALIDLIIIAIRIGILARRYKKWRKFATPTIGIVGDLKNVTYSYDRRRRASFTRYDYTLKINCGGQEFEDVYFEECQSDDDPITCPGDKINILWSANDHKYLNLDSFKPECQRIAKQTIRFTVSILFRAISRQSRQ